MTNRIKKISRRNTILFATIATLVIIATGLFLFIRQDRLNKNLLNAVEANDAQRVISLLDQGANPNSRKILDKKRSVLIILQTMFHLSKDDLNEDATPLLLALNPNFMTETNEDLEPPENVAMIEALLKHGANPNIGYRLRVNNQIFTPLYFAIFGHKKDSSSISRGFVSAGELMEIFSAPQPSTSSASPIDAMPPATQNGRSSCSATRRTQARSTRRPSGLAVMS